MSQIKKLIFVALAGIGGLLLTLAGLNLIELSKDLNLYAGIALLVLAGLLYLFI